MTSPLMLAFEGTILPDWLRRDLEESRLAGVTLFRELNMTSPDQVAELTGTIQSAGGEASPLLVAVDQEGGQLLGLIDSTPFAGNMALGAAGDPDLTRRVYAAMGVELASVGINLDYAPVADLATRPGNPSLGVRSFGEDPATVATHVAAAVQGLASSGILCTLKHFPGKGEALVDPHYELPRLDLDRDRLDSVELAPFAAGFEAGAHLVMTGHYDVPALTGDEGVPVSMSANAIDGLIRSELGFAGLVITDALDMGALDQGAGQVIDIIASLRGGTDLLLVMPDPALRERASIALDRGVGRGLIPAETLERSGRRVDAVRRGLPAPELAPSRVGSHGDLADELARGSVTLVRNDAGLIPLSLEPSQHVLVLEPQPTNVTPADTSALYPPIFTEAVRGVHEAVTGVVYPHDPDDDDVAALAARASGHDLVIVGTVNASRGQVALVKRLAATGIALVTVAMREPQDLPRYPDVATHLCTYSAHWPSLSAAAMAMFGLAEFPGRLPVTIPGIYPVGHGI